MWMSLKCVRRIGLAEEVFIVWPKTYSEARQSGHRIVVPGEWLVNDCMALPLRDLYNLRNLLTVE